LGVVLSGCAAGAWVRGGSAERQQDYDRAIVEYKRALRLNPDDNDVRRALERATLRAAQHHFSAGRRLAAAGHFPEARIEYELAAELNPGSSAIGDAARALRDRLRHGWTTVHQAKTALQALIERTRNLPPSGDLPDVRMPGTLLFRSAGSREVFLSIARFGDIDIWFDPAFRETVITVDLRNATLTDALDTLAAITGSFYRVSRRTVLVIPDTPANRREYQEEVVRTYYLSNADLKETMDLLRTVLDARRISPTTSTNAITIRDTADRVAAAGRLISGIDKARPEVIVDVELLEVDRTQLVEYGLQIASGGLPGIDGSATIAEPAPTGLPAPPITMQSLRTLTQDNVVVTNLPRLYYRLLKTDARTRTIANPQLRTSDGVLAQARFGDRIPVPVATFTPILTGGNPQQPVTSFTYENIGVNIDITPRTHHDGQVTLALTLSVQSISGMGFGRLPTFGNREVTNVIRLKDGETNMVAGLLRDDQRRLMQGVPGLTRSVLGSFSAHSRVNGQETDIIVTLTPRVVRVLHLAEEDLRQFAVRPGQGPPPPQPLPDVFR
jgi:general secretion pathway protein D